MGTDCVNMCHAPAFTGARLAAGQEGQGRKMPAWERGPAAGNWASTAVAEEIGGARIKGASEKEGGVVCLGEVSDEGRHHRAEAGLSPLAVFETCALPTSVTRRTCGHRWASSGAPSMAEEQPACPLREP